MELLKNIARTSAGLLVSMPVPGIIRITDGIFKFMTVKLADSVEAAEEVA